ncbi:hypothetical protein QUF58_08445 [Anaerolineales bacterium HSG24]|nr:hypothetical protein [Anaerolineales bacterium HSG24]
MPTEPTNDEIEELLRQAKEKGLSTNLSFDKLPAPNLDQTVGEPDDTEQAEQPLEVVPFDDLPAPSAPPTRPMPVDSAPAHADTTQKTSKPRRAISRLTNMASSDTDQKTDFWLMLPLFVIFRGLTLLLLRPGGFIRDWSDFDTYFGIAALSDYNLYPFLNFWLEWPPILPWLAVGSYKLALFLPPWSDDPRLWFILILGMLFLLFEVGNFVLIYRLSQRLELSPNGQTLRVSNTQTLKVSKTFRVLWLYMGLFPPLYAMLGFFDCMALFCILLALELLLAERYLGSAVVVGVGIGIKLIPVLIVPVALRYFWSQHQYSPQKGKSVKLRGSARPLTPSQGEGELASLPLGGIEGQSLPLGGIRGGLYLLTVGLTVFLIFAPFLIYGPQWVMTSVRSIMNRGAWETIWAVMDGYYGFGVVLGDRLNPAETTFTTHTSILPWWLITLLFAGWYILIATTHADYTKPRLIIAFTGFTIMVLFMYSKGYSPQFLIYILPVILLLFPDGRGLTYALVLTGLNILEQPIYFVLLPDATWLLTIVVTARFLIWLMLAVEFLLIIWPDLKQMPRFEPIYRRIPLALGVLTAFGLLILTPLSLQAYNSQRLTDSPLMPVIRFMQAQSQQSSTPPRLIVSDQATYRQLYPYLYNRLDLRLAGGDAMYQHAPAVSELLTNAESVWLLPTGNQQQIVSNAVANTGAAIGRYEFADIGILIHYNLTGQFNPNQAVKARFIGGIELVAHDIQIGGDMANVTLFWRTSSPVSGNYKVFTQILDANGQLISGHDGVPANGLTPTNSWSTNMVYIDQHQIILPPDKSLTGARVIAGLYNNVGERLIVTAPNGVSYPDRAVPLN